MIDTNVTVKGHQVFRGLSYAKIEHTMRFYRERFVPGLAPDEPFPCSAFFRSLSQHHVAAWPSVEVALTDDVFEELPGILGKTWFSLKQKRIIVALSEQQYHDMEAGDPRAHYSLAHEAAHAALHGDYIVYRGMISPEELAGLNRAEGGTHRHFQDSEWQAQAGAAVLLAPADGLDVLDRRGELTPRQVAARFQISREAAAYRIQNFQRRHDELLRACAQGKEKGPSW